MKINKVGVGGGVDTNNLIDRIMEGERAPNEAAKVRRTQVEDEKNEYTAFSGMLSDFGNVASGMKLPSGFNRMAVESSHPDIIEGVVDGVAEAGTYEFEVRGLAKADKFLAVGFPDANKTPVGFGFMGIERDDGGMSEVVIDPGSTLQDVAAKINDAAAGVKASVVNTGMAEDPFRLMVTSEKTGAASKIHLDADTTFLDFKNIKGGQDLDLKFEDVDIKRPENKLNDLLGGIKLDAKKAEPGTRVTVNVRPDVDKTFDGVKDFTVKYNQIANFVNTQFKVDTSQGRAGKLAGDGNLRSIMRSLQGEIAAPQANATGKFRSLSEVGVKTNAKSGELEIDDTKLKAALAEDYQSVASLFVSGEHGEGVAARMSNAIRNFQDPEHGVVKNRLKSLDQSIKNQDKQIEQQTNRLAEREATIQHQMQTMQTKVASLNAQGDFIAARFGGESASEAPKN